MVRGCLLQSLDKHLLKRFKRLLLVENGFTDMTESQKCLKMPTGSSRRKARVPLHITKQEVVEDGATMDIDDDGDKPMLDVEAPNNTSETRCNGKADDSKIKTEPQLPEGTVVVQPEAVPDNDSDFKGPEFKSRSKSRRSAQKETLSDSDSDFEEPMFKSRSKSRRCAPKDVIVEMDRVHCTSCNKQVNHLDSRTFKPHPALKVIICRKCFDYYKSGKFTKDDDGIDEQCRWCAEGGSLICCDFCSNVFCKKCIKQNLGRGSLSGLLSEEDSKWNCYVCNPSPLKQLQKICKDVVLGNKSVTAGKTRLLHPNISRVSVCLQMKPNSPSLEITSEGLRVRNILRPRDGKKPSLKMALWLVRNLQQTAETAKEEIKKALLSKSSIGRISKEDNEVQSDENNKWLSLKFDGGKPATPRQQTSKAQKSPPSKQAIKSETSGTEVSSSAAAATAPSESDDNHSDTKEQNGTDVENVEISTTLNADIPSSAACSSSGEGALDAVLAESDGEKSEKTGMECDGNEEDKMDAEAKNVGQSVKTVTGDNNAKTHRDQNEDEKDEKMESDDENQEEVKETSSKENNEKANEGSEEPQDGDENDGNDENDENDGNDETETQEYPKERSQEDIECEKALMDEIKEMPDQSDEECATPKKQTTKPLVTTPLRIKLEKISSSKLKEKYKSPRRQKTTPKSPRSSSDKHETRSSDSEDASEAKSEAPKSKVSKDALRDEKESDNSAISSSDDVDSSTLEDVESSGLEDVDWKSQPRRSLRIQKDTDVDNDRDNGKKLKKKAIKKESKKQKDSDSDADVPKGSEKKKTKEKHSGPGQDSSNLEEDSDEVEKLITPKRLQTPSRRSIKLKLTPKSSPKSKMKSKGKVRESDSSNFDSDLEREINNLTKAPSKTKKIKQDEGENESCQSADDEGGDEVSEKKESTSTKEKDKNVRGKTKLKGSKETEASTDSSSDSEAEAQGSDDSQDCEDAQLLETMSNGELCKDEMGREKLTAEDALDSDLENKLAEQQLMDEIENELDKEDTDDGESGSEDSSGSDLPKKTKPKTKKKKLGENGSEDNDDDDDEYKGEKEEDEEEDESSEYQESSQDEKPSKKKKGRRHRLMRVKLGESSSSDNDKDDDASDSASKKTHKSKKGKKRGHGSCSTSDSDVLKSKSKKGAKRGRRKRSSSGSEHSSNDFKKERSYNRGKGKGKKRRRIKVASDSDSDVEKKRGSGSSNDEKESPNKHGRKRIRKLISRDRLKDETVRAAKEEKERRKRIEEKRTMVTEISEEAAEAMGTVDEIILERDLKTKEVVLSVMESLAKQLKPHQVEGVKFIWDCTYETIEKIKEKGSGCILAHCMGLGKTLQVITFLHTIMTNEKISALHALVVAPLNTVLNWVTEFEKWLGEDSEIEVFEITSYKNNWQRADALKYWHDNGGVMVMGYSMYRQLSMHKFVKNKKQRTIFTQALVDPGPDIVVCDEGHMLKNDASAISKALNSIKTLRRICLTGTPLQNNLIEYHCMVDFVKPNLLGTRREFLNRFVNPITNGQCADSTQKDVKIMKRRAHVLHDMLNGCVQRKDYGALTKFLPPKYEYVISVRLTPVQVKLYELYLQSQSRNDSGQVIEGTSKGSGAGLFADYQQLMQIWTHPQVLKLSEIRQEKAQSRAYLSDFITSESEEEVYDNSDDSDQEFVVDNSEPEEIMEEDMPSTSSNTGTRRTRLQEHAAKQEQERDKPEKKKPRREGGDSDSSLEIIKTWKTRSRCRDPSRENVTRTPSPTEHTAKPKWYDEFIQEGDDTKIELSGKLVILFDVLKHAESIGEKVLVFSQSLLSLDLIEDMLQSLEDRAQVEREEGSQDPNNQIGGIGSWIKGEDYFRMDGSTSAALRKTWAEIFNDMNNYRARLFLISTKAGSLGTNLIGANRVIIFDASWNPSHDIQSIFRVYRFGQARAVYVYRLVAQGTMEEKIYERQVTKQSLSCRVVDEHQIERHFTSSDLSELYTFTPDRLDDPNRPERETPVLPKDYVLAEMLKHNDKWIVTYHEHDSLLENIESEELTEEERKNAWKEYEDEKEGRIRMTIDPRLLVTQGMNQQDLAKLQGIYGQTNPQMAQLVGNQHQYVLPKMVSPSMTQAALLEQLAMSGSSSSSQQMQQMIMYQRHHMEQQLHKAQQAKVLQQQQQLQLQQQEQQQLATMRKKYYMDDLIAMAKTQAQLAPKTQAQLTPKTQATEARGESTLQGLIQSAKLASQGGRSSGKSGT